VAGATRGVGRGIALALGESGATVYCTGRSTRTRRTRRSRDGKKAWPDQYYAGRPETIEETAGLVSARGGKGIAVVLDHLEIAGVKKLLSRIRKDHGKLHILINDISESAMPQFGKPFWMLDVEKGFAMFRNAVHTHIITSHFAAPLMMDTAKGKSTAGLIVEIGDGDSYTYRGNLFFDMVKTTVIRLAFAMAREMRRKNVATVAITPGFLRSEVMLEQFGVTEENWRDAVKKEPMYIASETPLYVGRAIAALAADPNLMKKSGRVYSSWGLSEQYDFCDADGRRPHLGKKYKELYGRINSCDEGFYEYWTGGPLDTIWADWP
jgi:NAD(P)-dependent dehydrogenase (short-subunit alcohol dehydrogenase family)